MGHQLEPAVNRDQFLNILAFQVLMAGEDAPAFLANKAPEYMIEKWERYIKVLPPDGPAWEWGLHPILRCGAFDPYVERWKADLDELFPTKDEGES